MRRSFKTLGEAVGTLVGVRHQIQGHQPKGTAEKHYTVRDIDTLREYHIKIEEYFLEKAGVKEPIEKIPIDMVRSLLQGVGVTVPLSVLQGMDRKSIVDLIRNSNISEIELNKKPELRLIVNNRSLHLYNFLLCNQKMITIDYEI